MKKANNTLVIMTFAITIALLGNEPSDPYIVGPTRVMVGLQNIAYSLENFNKDNVSCYEWHFENCSTHEIVTNKRYYITSPAHFNMPDSSCHGLIDVKIIYSDDSFETYSLGIQVFLMSLTQVRREGIDLSNDYLGPEPNVPIHFNINNDVRVQGGDYLRVTRTDEDDDDLLSLKIRLYPPNVYLGDNSSLKVSLFGTSARIWSSKKKDTLILDNNIETYTFPSHELYLISNTTFYVEACNLGMFYIKVYINDNAIDSSMRYNAYAVCEGAQPLNFESVYPQFLSLKGCEWSLIRATDNSISASIFSSLGYAVDPECETYSVPFIVQETKPHINDINELVVSNFLGNLAYYTNVDGFGNGNQTLEIGDLYDFFTSYIWPHEYYISSDYGSIIYYSNFHASRKMLSCAGARQSWRMYKSKYTAGPIFIHRDIQLDEGSIILNFDITEEEEEPIE